MELPTHRDGYFTLKDLNRPQAMKQDTNRPNCEGLLPMNTMDAGPTCPVACPVATDARTEVASATQKLVAESLATCAMLDCSDPRCQDILVPLRLVLTSAEAVAAGAADSSRLTLAVEGLLSWQMSSVGQVGVKPSIAPISWDGLAVDGRIITICPPSDFRQKQPVLEALEARATELRNLGAKRVMVEVLPHAQDGRPQTLTDIIDRFGTEMFLALAGVARPCFQEGKKLTTYCFDPEPDGTHARAQYLIPLIGLDWRRAEKDPRAWWHWSGKHWEPVVGHEHLEADLEKFFETQQWNNRESSTIKSAVAAIRRAISTLSLIEKQKSIPFSNGCLRLSDRVLLGHNREHGNTWILPYDYDAGATANSIVEFLLTTLGSEEALTMFRAFARCVLTRTREKAFLELFGPGNTGKTVIANLLMAMVGFMNVTASRLELLENRKLLFQTYRLRGKALVVFSEAQNYNGPLETLKAITGGDRIVAEAKGSHAVVDFVFEGAVLIVGNGPIGASDPTGAVLSRRRSIPVLNVVPPDQRRPLLDADGHGGWTGEFVDQLPGLVNWVLEMTEEEARAVLLRHSRSQGSPQADFATLVRSDPFAAWAEECLVYAPGGYSRVGDGTSNPSEFLYPNYVQHHQNVGEAGKPIPLRMFKEQLVGRLRDHHNLGLPQGCLQSGCYRVRGEGSVIPNVRLRTMDEGPACDQSPGVLRHAMGVGAEPAVAAETGAGDGDTSKSNGESMDRPG